jgi:hypothetical protein
MDASFTDLLTRLSLLPLSIIISASLIPLHCKQGHPSIISAVTIDSLNLFPAHFTVQILQPLI